MEVIIQPTPEEASRLAARLIAGIIGAKPDAVLGLATGRTPVMLYAELVRLHQREGLDFSRVTTFNLDEYVGLSPDHPASYHAFMHEHFFRHINIDPGRIHIPDGMASDIPSFCATYEEDIRAEGGIDVQILGIGTDGHVGFNEPSSSLASRTRIKTLTARTRSDNAPDFGGADKVPHHVITAGIGTIMDSRMCILLAFGENKADAINRSVEGPVTAMMPASVLQMHPVAKAFLDGTAASKLSRANYYKWVYDHKPEWQRF
ncbi:MAG: glucosamine-6-phosphate deaminase [Verrucomicrobia bacterium]|nr:glucosamine-6-phosphate deaminase [Verrucomicrobiota bacterium]